MKKPKYNPLLSQRLDVDNLLPRLNSVVPTANGWQACCPAHSDTNSSLSISVSDSGRLLLCCHAGCSFREIVKAVKGTAGPSAALQAFRTRQRATKAKRLYTGIPDARKAVLWSLRQSTGRDWHHVMSWMYHQAQGGYVGQVDRYRDTDGNKSYRPVSRRDGGYVIGDPEGGFPIYQLPTVLASSETVYVVEGEKCADSLLALGYTATTSAHGAGAASKADWSPLAGRNVVIVPDGDTAGAKYADEVEAILQGLDCVVGHIALPDDQDIADWIEDRAGKMTLDEVRQAFDAVKRLSRGNS